MPITLSCPCGKTLRVGDEHAGKRVKCPACGAIATAPTPEPRPEVVAAPPKQPKPAETPKDDEDDGEGYRLQPDERTAPVPPPVPEFRKRGNADEDDEDTDDDPRRRAAARLSRPAARRDGKKEAQRGVYLGCGALAVIFGVVLLLIDNANGEPKSTKVIVAGITIAVFGVVSVIQAITGTMPDDED